MKRSSTSTTEFLELKNKFRGLVSKYRSSRFVKDRIVPTSAQFRSGLRDLFLDARVVLNPSQFDDFQIWLNHQIETQLADFLQLPIGYEELAGVYTEAPVATLERELLWITSRIKADADRINAFRTEVEEVERLVFIGKIRDAIEGLKIIQDAFGISFWSVQLRIALEHQAGGLEQQKRYTAEVRSVYKRGLLGFVAYHTSVRNEDRTTLAKFCDDIKVRIDKHQYFEPFVKTYTRFRLAGEWPASESGLADILRVEQSHSSIDIYETFIAVAQEIARRKDFYKAHKVLTQCLRNLAPITDFRIAKVALVLGALDVSRTLSPRSFEISDILLLGDAKLAAQTARRSLRAPHNIDIWQFIYAGLAFGHATRPRDKELRRPNDVSRILGKILSRCDDLNDSFAQLGKLVINLRGLSAAAGLLDLLQLLRRSYPDDPWQPWFISMNSPTIGVEDLVPNTSVSDLPVITAESHNILSPTEAVWRLFHGEGSVSANVSQAALTLFTSAGLLRNGQCRQVVDLIGVQNGDCGSEPLRSIAASMLLHAYFCLGYRQNVITLIADEGARSEANRRLLPVLPSLENYAWPDYKAVSAPLAAPIALHLLWSLNEDKEIASRLRYATGSFFRIARVARPSKLIELSEVYPRHQLVYFLREVCVPHILDSCRVLKSSREVMEERQAICLALRELDPANANDYQDEALSISNQLALDEGQWIVDRTRVYVDTDALSRWAAKELSEDYARYRDLLGVNIGSQNFEDVLKELTTAALSQRSTFTPENEADAVLFGMLHRMREEFLYNPSLGLDFYLSNRVRHHSFIGLIRRPLESAGLITTRESESSDYRRNEFWLEKFDCSSSEAKEALNEAFAKFAANFDETLTVAKDSFYVHSLERPGGLLYLELTTQLISIVRAIDQMDTTLTDFISTADAVLWAAIEPSLAKVRYFISEDLKNKITDGFNELRATVRKHAEQGPALLEFDIAIGNCSTEVQYKLDEAAKWFSHADLETQKRHFKLDQIVNIAIDSALKCQRAFDPDIKRHVEGDIEMQASNLVFIHDVLFVALDNVRAHSDCKKPKVNINVQANTENGTLIIEVRSDAKVQNRVKHDEELRRIRQLIESGNFGRHTRREGGSGILKLAAVVLRQSAKGRIDFGFTETGQFELRVTYSMIVLTPNQQEGNCE